MSAHERVAQRLAPLASAEREWVLARLAPGDALRIRELMHREPTEAVPPRQALAEPGAAPESVLERASPADVARLLQDEPDWLIALVLAKRRWPWDRKVLERFEPARLEALGELARAARAVAKARACDAAVSALEARVRSLAPAPGARSAFDELLAGMTEGDGPLPGGQAWPS